MYESGVPIDIEATLALAERSVYAVSQALLQGQPDLVESATRDLQQASLTLSSVLQGLKGKTSRDQQLRQRLGKVVRGISMQREALLRRSAVVEMALHSMLPATRTPTYGGAAPYSRYARQSGAFKLLSA